MQCDLKLQHYESVHGGDINEAYCLFTSAGKYFLKVNDTNKYPAMFEKEARGLDLLREGCPLIIPRIIKWGTTGEKQWLVLEWLDKGSPKKDMWEKFGQALALLHQQTQKYFGLDEDNYIGSLKQTNKKHNNWEMFYAECRLIPLLKLSFDQRDLEQPSIDPVEEKCRKLAGYFPKEPPALLHGDLWAGNYLIHASGYAAVYDPAVYFGHREMDIGMTKLFGGFDQRFYDAYTEVYPLEKGWERRVELAQLYPLLVHAALFGGHYLASVRNIFQKYH